MTATGRGGRGARLAEEFRGRFYEVGDEDFARLMKACRLHTVAGSANDLTVRTCFDADRLDLPRVGTIVDPQRLCTEAARRPDILAWARARSERDADADILADWLA